MGTAFIGCDETRPRNRTSTRSPPPPSGDTVVTPAFTGRPARALRTGWVDEIESSGAELPPYPLQAMLLAELRAAGLESGELETVMRLAGQGAPLLRRGPAADLVGELAAETEAALIRAAGGARDLQRVEEAQGAGGVATLDREQPPLGLGAARG